MKDAVAVDTSDDECDGEEDNQGNDGNGGCGGSCRPKEKGKTSRYKGVHLDGSAVVANRPRPWRASIWINNTTKALGHFSSEESAARAYDRYARRHGRPGIVFNSPDGSPGSEEVRFL